MIDNASDTGRFKYSCNKSIHKYIVIERWMLDVVQVKAGSKQVKKRHRASRSVIRHAALTDPFYTLPGMFLFNV